MELSLLAFFLQVASPIGLPAASHSIDVQAVQCMAKNIYHEARGEKLSGQYAIAFATLNRVKKPGYPDNVCDVIKYKTYVKQSGKTVCAFSWFCNPSKRSMSFVNKDGELNEVNAEKLKDATEVALKVLSGAVKDNTNGATHFFNPQHASPSWQYTMKRTAVYGNHVFYR